MAVRVAAAQQHIDQDRRPALLLPAAAAQTLIYIIGIAFLEPKPGAGARRMVSPVWILLLWGPGALQIVCIKERRAYMPAFTFFVDKTPDGPGFLILPLILCKLCPHSCHDSVIDISISLIPVQVSPAWILLVIRVEGMRSPWRRRIFRCQFFVLRFLFPSLTIYHKFLVRHLANHCNERRYRDL